MTQVRPSLTLEEFRALPEQKPYLEFWNGEIVQKMAPQKNHSWLQDEIAGQLRSYRKQHGGRSGTEPSILFDNADDRRELIPDVAYWAQGKTVGGPVMLPPTLAVEVRSAGQSSSLLRGKCEFYRRNGVDAAWLVDPESRTVEVFEEGREGVVLRDDATLTSPVLPDFELPLRELFAVLDEE
jgi:Uma2 family endonuclease